MTRDFTLNKYAELCEALKSLSCPIMTVRDFLNAGPPSDFSVILRHDVDRGMNAALRMAELEADMGIAATYYVRTRPGVFKPEALKRLHHLGHEVGYHYEVLAKTKGNQTQAIALFERELKRFREIVPVETISMHGSPLSRWNNLNLWRAHHFEDYSLKDAILSIKTKEMCYFTDTGRCWDADRYNIRDRVNSLRPPSETHATDDLVNFLSAEPNISIYINTHPNRWAINLAGWGLGAVSDWTINRIKFFMQGLLSLRAR
jgi:hypothetical protein